MVHICDKCHRGIHGEGGELFSKEELYEYKKNPKGPSILRDQLPLERKRHYTFIIGSNLIAHGSKAALSKFPGGHHLAAIDTSEGVLKLTILEGIKNSTRSYLIEENELVIDSQDIWDMRYSRDFLKIWRMKNYKKTIFIDLIIRPDVIIIRRMNTTFNNIAFRIYKLRNPQKQQVDKIVEIVNSYENLYKEISEQIDQSPKMGRVFDGFDFDDFTKQTQKNIIKTRMEQALFFDHSKQFKWDRSYYHWIIQKILDNSEIFGKRQYFSYGLL